MIHSRISIDDLMDIVRQGGKVKTGIDVYNAHGVLLLEKDIVVNRVKTLEIIKAQGLGKLPLNPDNYGGIWDSEGNYLKVGEGGAVTVSGGGRTSSPIPSTGQEPLESHPKTAVSPKPDSLEGEPGDIDDKPPHLSVKHVGEIEKRLQEIDTRKKAAAEKYKMAKEQARKVLKEIRISGGEFDYVGVEESVTELVDFFAIVENPFAYLTRDIFRYDDYLFTHCVNVCAVGSAMLNRFNINFSGVVNRHIEAAFPENSSLPATGFTSSEGGTYRCYLKDDIQDITMGFFLHDIGKVLIPDKVLYKKGKLTVMEFDMIQKHSYLMGATILEKNRLKNSIVRNMVQYHHAALFEGEKRCYPVENIPAELPLYVKMCKLADIYDAMVSKQCYKEAYNPIGVVTDIFRKYAKKDYMLQFVLHAFVKSIGIYPTGSIIYLMNGQMAYVLESAGPLVLPFTDFRGNTLKQGSTPLDLGEAGLDETLKPDGFRSIHTALEVYDKLPSYLKPGKSRKA